MLCAKALQFGRIHLCRKVVEELGDGQFQSVAKAGDEILDRNVVAMNQCQAHAVDVRAENHAGASCAFKGIGFWKMQPRVVFGLGLLRKNVVTIAIRHGKAHVAVQNDFAWGVVVELSTVVVLAAKVTARSKCFISKGKDGQCNEGNGLGHFGDLRFVLDGFGFCEH